MKVLRIVKKEDSPTIPLNKVDLCSGFIVVTSDDENVGIIVYDTSSDHYIFIDSFYDSFTSGLDSPNYYADELHDLMGLLKRTFEGPVEFNFIEVEQ